jgi:cyclopropane fatty-acyl-phospholipid synthase-like methyltransferase
MNHRNRIYQNYVSSIDDLSKVKKISNLENRKPTLLHLILKFFPQDRSSLILDLGCGHGTLVHFAKSMGYKNIKGVDTSAQQIELAHQLGISEVYQGDLLKELQKQKHDSIDAIITFDVIEHFSKHELTNLIDATYSTLRFGGRWIIHAPNGQSPFVGTILYGDFTHELAFTESSLRQLMLSTGFSKIEFFECRPLVYNTKSLVRFLLWQLIKIILIIVNAAETGSISMKTIWTRNLYAVVYK